MELHFVQHFEPICCELVVLGPNCCTLCNIERRKVGLRAELLYFMQQRGERGEDKAVAHYATTKGRGGTMV
jgi:hypothetical protein